MTEGHPGTSGDQWAEGSEESQVGGFVPQPGPRGPPLPVHKDLRASWIGKLCVSSPRSRPRAEALVGPKGLS